MTVVVLGASGRLGSVLRKSWGRAAATYLGRTVRAEHLQDCTRLIDLRGILPGHGDLSFNITLAQEALDTAKAAGVSRVFLASSAAVYGRHPDTLAEAVAAPVSDYGHAKRAMEVMAAGHAQPNTVLRIGNVAGADAILGAWKPGFTLDTLPDGTTPLRSYIGPEAFARVIQTLCALDNLPGILNLAAPVPVQMGHLLDAAELAWQPRPATDATIPRVVLDTTRLETLVDFTADDSQPQQMVAEWQKMKDAP